VSDSHNINILEEACLCFEDGFCKLPFVLVELVWFLQHGLWYCHQNIVAVSFSASIVFTQRSFDAAHLTDFH